MLNTPPTIFLSAVSDELGEIRQLLHDSFKSHFQVITQDETIPRFPGGDLRQLLTDAIDRSHAVIHLAGEGFGRTAMNPFPDFPGFHCSWTQFEYYYAHSFDTDPLRRKQVFAVVCGPSLRSAVFKESSDDILDVHTKTGLQHDHCLRIFSGRFDSTPLAPSLPPEARTINNKKPVDDHAAALRAAIDICSQLAASQPALESACSFVRASLEEKLLPFLERIEDGQKRHYRFSKISLVVILACIAGNWLASTHQGNTNQHGSSQEFKQLMDEFRTLVIETRQRGGYIEEYSRDELGNALARRRSMTPHALNEIIDAGKKSDDAIDRGRAELLAGDRRKAIETFNQQARQTDDLATLDLKWKGFYESGEYLLAEAYLRRVLEISEERLGGGDAETARVQFRLASLLAAQGKLVEAEALYRKSIQIGEIAIGENEPEISAWINGLANVLRSNNKIEEVDPLYRRILRIAFLYRKETGEPFMHENEYINHYTSFLMQTDHSPEQIESEIRKLKSEAGLKE